MVIKAKAEASFVVNRLLKGDIIKYERLKETLEHLMSSFVHWAALKFRARGAKAICTIAKVNSGNMKQQK